MNGFESWADVKAWLRAFVADADNGAKYFSYGTNEMLKNATRGAADFDYPVLHCEQPAILPNDNEAGNFIYYFDFGLVAMTQYGTMGDRNENQASFEEAEEICRGLLSTILKDLNHKRNDFWFDFDMNACSIDPVADGWIDNWVGYRLGLKIGVGVNPILC